MRKETLGNSELFFECFFSFGMFFYLFTVHFF